MKAGILPDLLVSQVKNTASWLWTDPRAEPATRALDDVVAAESTRQTGEGVAYLRLLLAAHYATVATFVPTDVDARIRHHAWQAIDLEGELAAAVGVVDEAASWDVSAVSARVHPSVHGPLSGHDGEWLAVRAGALGRAAVLGAGALVESLVRQIDGELDREETIFREALGANVAVGALSAATIIAHNLGDLSRVVAEWPRHDDLAGPRGRWVRLAHGDVGAKRSLFVTAGALNKALVAHENHRFLPLRKPRVLRSSRALLLPLGPWFDAWGERVGRDETIENGDRAEILAALLEIHGRDAAQDGCLRAIAGLHRATRGGIEALVPDLPARMRKDALRGRVREVLDITPDRFAARVDRKYRAARESIGAPR